MASLFARQAWTSVSRTSAFKAPRLVSLNAFPQRRCFSVSSNQLQRKYAESHEWVDIAADGKTCTVGISAYAAGALGDVVYVELPAVGDDVTVGEAFGTVESVKSASDVNSPISGSVVEVNQPIADTPSDLGLDPEGEGWLIKIEAEDVSALEGLMDEAAYTEHTKDK